MSAVGLQDKVAIVTGAGSGLGRSEAIELARRGAKVVVNDLDAARAQLVVDAILDAGGIAITAPGSVASEAGGAELVARACEAFGDVSVLVNNAGILRPGWFEELSSERIDEIIAVHLKGAFNVTQPAWRVMKANSYGRIIMTGSSSGLFGHEMISSYAAAKGGIYGLTKALAYEGAAANIKVNVVLPYAQTAIRSSDSSDAIVPYTKKMRESAESHRLARAPEEVMAKRNEPHLTASLVAYLASEQCEPSGEAFSVCFGRFARVFVGVADGWLAPDGAAVTAEEIAAHLPLIRDLGSWDAPMWLHDEVAAVEARIARTPSIT